MWKHLCLHYYIVGGPPFLFCRDDRAWSVDFKVTSLCYFSMNAQWQRCSPGQPLRESLTSSRKRGLSGMNTTPTRAAMAGSKHTRQKTLQLWIWNSVPMLKPQPATTQQHNTGSSVPRSPPGDTQYSPYEVMELGLEGGCPPRLGSTLPCFIYLHT